MIVAKQFTMKIVEMNHFMIKIKDMEEKCVVSEVGEFLLHVFFSFFFFFRMNIEYNQ